MPVPTERNLVYECLDQMFKERYLYGDKKNMGCICFFNSLKIIWHPFWRKAYNISNQLQFKDDLRQKYSPETLSAFHKQLERELDFIDKTDRLYIISVLVGFVGVIISVILEISGWANQVFIQRTLMFEPEQFDTRTDYFSIVEHFFSVIVELILDLKWGILLFLITAIGIVVYFFIRYLNKRFKVLYFLSVLQLIVEEQAFQKSADQG
ncbi:hypothetical protein GCM10010965_23420 [Caldalkalibacillus thermarum]|uniref:hypothetical protein n=1 Tax=Caldalkalibacillus thermarum TaxID=296745 RepID=UPI00166CA1D3|nr:hypothetical protein [Caldalkalibacillus thermarum]GGK29883.1 hypothetical protein GCM10010965_23420 [Caldalkalibacillus thermarum]